VEKHCFVAISNDFGLDYAQPQCLSQEMATWRTTQSLLFRGVSGTKQAGQEVWGYAPLSSTYTPAPWDTLFHT